MHHEGLTSSPFLWDYFKVILSLNFLSETDMWPRGEQVPAQAMNSGLSPLTQNHTTSVMRKLDQPFPKSVLVSLPSPPGET